MPAGTWPTTCSAPADRIWMAFSLGQLVMHRRCRPRAQGQDDELDLVRRAGQSRRPSIRRPRCRSGSGCRELRPVDRAAIPGSTSPPPGQLAGPVVLAVFAGCQSQRPNSGRPAVRYQVRVFGVLAGSRSGCRGRTGSTASRASWRRRGCTWPGGWPGPGTLEGRGSTSVWIRLICWPRRWYLTEPANSPPTCSSYLDSAGLSVTTGSASAASPAASATATRPRERALRRRPGAGPARR